jgi:hypothetical protein
MRGAEEGFSTIKGSDQNEFRSRVTTLSAGLIAPQGLCVTDPIIIRCTREPCT